MCAECGNGKRMCVISTGTHIKCAAREYVESAMCVCVCVYCVCVCVYVMYLQSEWYATNVKYFSLYLCVFSALSFIN